jgi:hypothetical protein
MCMPTFFFYATYKHDNNVVAVWGARPSA